MGMHIHLRDKRMLSNFNKEDAIALLQLQQTVPFPVDFDEAWQWLEYSTKHDALESFKKCDFLESIDFRSFQESPGKLGGRPNTKYQLTIDCFKSWGMMAGTEKGKEIRRYFLECEKIAIAATKSQAQELPKRYPEQVVESVANAIATVQQKVAAIDPRLAQVLIDHAMRGIDQVALPGGVEPKTAGVVEIAESLGYKVEKLESKLGRRVAKCWRDAFGVSPQEARRECGGAMRPLKLYPKDEPVVIAAIHEFYSNLNQRNLGDN